MSDFFLEKVCIVTGSTQGLGKELAQQILKRGGKVVLNGRNQARKEEALATFKEFGENVTFIHGDVSNELEAQSIVDHAIVQFGKLDVLINNAGMSAFGNLEESDPSVIHTVLDSNLKGALLMSHFAIPHIKKEKGSIQFISSLTAIHGIGGYSLYSAAKMAYTGAAQALRIELHDAGVHVGVMYLGFTKNDSTKKTLNAAGEPVSVPNRNKFKVSTQEESALLILNQIAKRKDAVVHSGVGKLNHFVNRFFPRVGFFILRKAYQKTTRIRLE